MAITTNKVRTITLSINQTVVEKNHINAIVSESFYTKFFDDDGNLRPHVDPEDITDALDLKRELDLTTYTADVIDQEYDAIRADKYDGHGEKPHTTYHVTSVK